jgi:hypothetical protein
MRACKCRYCQTNTNTDDAYFAMIGKQRAYFCNEEHYGLFMQEREIKKKQEMEALEAARQKKKERENATQQSKEHKDRAYYLICDIIGRKQIINTALWKEWAIWNKVADNAIIGQYLEENKDYLCKTMSRIDNNEFLRIRYLSSILKNGLGDYKPRPKPVVREASKPETCMDFYEPIQTQNNKRRSLADLEDDF